MPKQLNEIVFTYSDYLKKKYGKKVFRVGLSTGIVCPHRSNNGGCIYCNSGSFTGKYQNKKLTIDEQLKIAIPKIKKGCGDVALLAYFQDETSTAGELSPLKEKFSQALSHKDIDGLVLSTRPDFFDKSHVKMLQSLQSDISVEFGMQTIHTHSLEFLNRGHTNKQTLRAIKLAAEAGFTVGVHLIMGLPTENFQQMKETILSISKNPNIHQVKFHNLTIYKNTKLADIYQKSKLKLLTIEQYIVYLAHLLTFLRKDIVVSRLFTSSIIGSNQELLKIKGPKTKWMGKLFHYMKDNHLSQGQNFEKLE